MLRSKLARAAGVLASVAALAAVTQTPASAATVNWNTSPPNLGNSICSSSTVLDQTNAQLFTCMTWGGGQVQSFTIGMNNQSSAVLFPAVTTGVTLNSAATNHCAALALPANESRFCAGPKLALTSGTCTSMFAFTQYTWFSGQVRWGQPRELCA